MLFNRSLISFVRHSAAGLAWLVVNSLLLQTAFSDTAQEFYALESAHQYHEHSYAVAARNTEYFKVATHHWSNGFGRLAVLVHGYADNCGYLKPVQRWMLDHGYDVLCIELPGHGNSSGKRADINAMEIYLDVYQQLFPEIFALPYTSFIYFGHSTGTVGMTELLLKGEPHEFDIIIMATPLIRSRFWTLSRFANTVVGSFVDRIPRRTLAARDPEYAALQKQDTEVIKKVPLHWFDSLIAWNKKLAQDKRKSPQKVFAIFAEDDTVIDTRFNQSFIMQRFPNNSIYTIADSDHIVHYEEAPQRQAFFDTLQKILKAQTTH